LKYKYTPFQILGSIGFNATALLFLKMLTLDFDLKLLWLFLFPLFFALLIAIDFFLQKKKRKPVLLFFIETVFALLIILCIAYSFSVNF